MLAGKPEVRAGRRNTRTRRVQLEELPHPQERRVVLHLSDGLVHGLPQDQPERHGPRMNAVREARVGQPLDCSQAQERVMVQLDAVVDVAQSVVDP